MREVQSEGYVQRRAANSYCADLSYNSIDLGHVYTVRTIFCTDKNLHGSTLRLHGTGGTVQIFERLSVQVWDLKKTSFVCATICPDPCKRGLKCTHLSLPKGFALSLT